MDTGQAIGQYTGNSDNNNSPLASESANSPPVGELEKSRVLNNSGWLRGFRVDNFDKPQVLPHQVASYADGAAPFLEEINEVSTEVVTTCNKRESNYVHHGWSVGAIATISPWTSSRIDAANRHNTEGLWITRRTLITRLKAHVLLQDLAPAPEFVAAIEAALGLPTKFERFQGVYLALSRWGDVVPLVSVVVYYSFRHREAIANYDYKEIEMGSSLTLTDVEANLAQAPGSASYNSFNHLSTIKTANIARKGASANVGWDDGTWTTIAVPATEWRPIRIVTVAPTVCLFTNDVQARLTELYNEQLSYIPPLTINPIGWLWKINDDFDKASKTISKLEIHSTGHIIGLIVYYLDGAISRAGREAGNVHTFILTNGEHIVEMLTCADGEWLRSIQFITNKGRCSVIYGTLEGTPVISRSKGGILAGFSISSKQHSEWGYLMASARGIWRYDLIPRAPKDNDVYSEYFGARVSHGPGFNDRALIGNSSSMYISNVEVRANTGINSIQFTYRDTRNEQPDMVKTPHHGGFGGTYYQFGLGDGEYIVSISGRYDEKYVTQLCFGTNLGRTSEVYGGATGQSFSARPSIGGAERRLRLQYILGKSDNVGLNGVMFVWTPVIQ
ncbi:unnamed protein product [Rhizoctonia solani]|uniref:Jacalin-type lectin domain-containing protein n=1 Tax=Rhizoctonia solani TaxID=456999 RepID=A0A8H3CRY3_9AGAM|nr:unnamed protein product [Rhizoctonia solani]